MAERSKVKRILYSGILLLIGGILAFLLGEIILRIYNPFPATVRGEKIVLRTNYKTIYHNSINTKLPEEIIVSGNSLGFRGPEPLTDATLSIITVGGSTTHCMYSSDEHTWSHLLSNKLKSKYPNLWLNNAGLSGHSSFGHVILMEDYIAELKPAFVTFLVGINDIEREISDKFLLYNQSSDLEFSNKVKTFLYKSEFIGLLINLKRFLHAHQANLTTGLDFDLNNLGEIHISKEDYSAQLKKQNTYLQSFRLRLPKLIEISRANNIIPLFITQPALFGNTIDPTTGIDLSKIEYGNRNGKLMWEILEKYNDITRGLEQEMAVDVIDLAKLMPKDSKYFRDYIHYTPEGNAKIAEILSPYLSERLKLYQKKR